MRSNIVYGFAAGALLACAVSIGVILIEADVARFEHIPVDIPEGHRRMIEQQQPEPIHRDGYTVGTDAPTTPGAKVSPPAAQPKPQKTQTATGSGTKGETGPGPTVPPVTTAPSVPVIKPTRRPVISVPIPLPVQINLPPFLKVN